MASRHRTDSHSTNGTLRAPESLGFNSWALAGEWTIGREQFVLDGPGAASPTASTRANAHLVLSPGAREAIPFRVLSTARLRACHTAWTWTRTGTACSGRPPLPLVRQHNGVREPTLEITLLDPGAEAYAFTFGSQNMATRSERSLVAIASVARTSSTEQQTLA
jgi:hypothetical protein